MPADFAGMKACIWMCRIYCFRKRLLYVRQGKNHRERYVPITAQALNTLQNYLLEARPQLTNNQKNSAFFVSQQGHRCGGQTLALSLNKLCQASRRCRR